MEKRVILSRLIRAMLLLLVMAFLYILFRSLGGPSLTVSTNNAFDNVVIGQTALTRVDRQRVWVTRLSKSQVRQAKALDSSVKDAQAGCKPSITLCVITAESLRSGVDIVYLATAPEQLPRGAPWFGGFIDPSSGGVFDFLGRAYKGVRSGDERDSLELIGR